MILAAAQIKPFDGAIEQNLEEHYRFVQLAVGKGADLILFPEMSLTGYQREKAHTLAFTPADDRLHKLKRLAQQSKITIIAGAPLSINNQLYIGAFIIAPDQSISLYTKQYLHTGEDRYFSSSFDYNPTITIAGYQLKLAICADLNQEEHASRANCDFYLASIFYSPEGVQKGYTRLGDYARKYQMGLLTANFVGVSWNFPAGGNSSYWNPHGTLTQQLGASDEDLLLIDCSH